ncbi:MAG TPA: MFS transporter [Verrucomicrobiae bacterium]|jgi:fucose permease|nr:MFS transporter [Verrucomicrobiae bacterium]
MARRSEIATVYAAGLVQGVALVTFPAAGAVFTSATGYALSNTQYGAMFEPQAVMAIVSSLLGAGLTSKLGTKRIFLIGLAANLAAMALLAGSKFVMDRHAAAYGLLLAATTCMGLGFGFTVPVLNTIAAAFFPQAVDEAILWLNALLGLGTALAPLFIAVFLALGAWWALPVLVGVLLLGLLAVSLPQSLDEGGRRKPDSASTKVKVPARFWLFAAFVLLYGICETMNGNWASLFMLNHLGANASMASVALALFWGMVTAGRVLFAAIEKWIPETVVFRVLPLVVVVAFVVCAWLSGTAAMAGILAFGLAGLGCSALLPLTISFAQKELRAIASSVAGGLIAFYQIGYGIAAFGVGPLEARAGLGLNTIFGYTAAVAVAMAVASFILVRPEKQISTQISNANT